MTIETSYFVSNMPRVRTRFEELGGDPSWLKTLEAESRFFLREISGLIRTLNPGSRILEIGCGGGITAAALAHAGFLVTAAEPFAEGFEKSKKALNAVRSTSDREFRLIPATIDAIPAQERFDLIVSFNVLEHTQSWETVLQESLVRLSPLGTILALCPNGDFPYEPHLGIPTCGSKQLTRALLKDTIRRRETTLEIEGLFDGLNFIRTRHVQAWCKANGLSCELDPGILPRMVARVAEDPEFRARHQGLLSMIGFNPLRRIAEAYSRLPHCFQPYFKATIRK